MNGLVVNQFYDNLKTYLRYRKVLAIATCDRLLRFFNERTCDNLCYDCLTTFLWTRYCIGVLNDVHCTQFSLTNHSNRAKPLTELWKQTLDSTLLGVTQLKYLTNGLYHITPQWAAFRYKVRLTMWPYTRGIPVCRYKWGNWMIFI